MNELNSISKDFPILDQFVNDEPLVYLDNARHHPKTSAGSRRTC